MSLCTVAMVVSSSRDSVPWHGVCAVSSQRALLQLSSEGQLIDSWKGKQHLQTLQPCRQAVLERLLDPKSQMHDDWTKLGTVL
eukprot:3702549-Amphidinium_carterae.1